MADNEDDKYIETEIGKLLMEALNRLQPEARNKEISDIIWRLQYEQRVAALTDTEFEAAFDEQLPEHIQMQIDALEGQVKKDRIEGIARAMYFRQCAWQDYLKGVEPNKPPVRVTMTTD